MKSVTHLIDDNFFSLLENNVRHSCIDNVRVNMRFLVFNRGQRMTDSISMVIYEGYDF
jgi:hypothetical protein